jgi:mannose-6-phosphate isomerase-like protein (cupin superfamily)
MKTNLAHRTTLVCFAAAVAAACGPSASVGGQALAIAAADPGLKWGPCPEIFPAGCEIAVLHGDPATANADVFLRVPSNYEIPPHSHTSAERMILATGELQVVYKGQPPATLTVGSYAYGPANAPHKAKCLSSEPCTLFIAFETPVDALPHDGEVD